MAQPGLHLGSQSTSREVGEMALDPCWLTEASSPGLSHSERAGLTFSGRVSELKWTRLLFLVGRGGSLHGFGALGATGLGPAGDA